MQRKLSGMTSHQQMQQIPGWLDCT